MLVDCLLGGLRDESGDLKSTRDKPEYGETCLNGDFFLTAWVLVVTFAFDCGARDRSEGCGVEYRSFSAFGGLPGKPCGKREPFSTGV